MSKLRIEKLKQGSASNNDVLVFRNDLGTFQGQSNLSVTTITLGTNTVNSSVFTGTAYLSNNATNLGGHPASYYANSSDPATAYANAVSVAATDASNKAITAYSNATAFAIIRANNAFINAVSVSSTDASNKADTAYSNAVTYADTKAAAAYSNAIAYSGNASLAYANAIAYAASNSYVNSTFAPLASPILTGLLTVSGDATISGNLVVNGTAITVNTTQINVTDSLMYLATDNEISDTLDIGFAGHYNNGSGANGHTGFIRSAITKKYYLFQNYQPEFFSNNNVDVANTSTGIQMADLVVGNLVANSTLIVTGSANVGSLNTTGTVTANVISVSNVEQTQTNLQVDPAGSAFLNAIIYG